MPLAPFTQKWYPFASCPSQNTSYICALRLAEHVIWLSISTMGKGTFLRNWNTSGGIQAKTTNDVKKNIQGCSMVGPVAGSVCQMRHEQ